MSDLSPEARELLDSTQGLDAPTFADRAAVRTGIKSRLAGGPIPKSSVVKASASNWMIGIGAKKALLAVVLVAGLGTAGAFKIRQQHANSNPGPPRVSAIAVSANSTEHSTTNVIVSAPTVFPPPLVTDENHEAGPPSRINHVQSDNHRNNQPNPITRAHTSVTPSNDGGADSLDSELALIREAERSLHDGNPRDALRLLGEHARRFPHGAFGEERSATRVLVLCALGRMHEAQIAAANFLTSSPRSPYAGRVRASCGIPQ